MKLFTKVFLIFILTITITSGCASDKTEADNRLTVAVSIVPQETFVKAVAGEIVNVVTMIPPGQSPETYSPSPQVMRQLSSASVYFAIGVPVEKSYILPWAAELNKNMEIVHLEEAVRQIHGLRYFDEEHGHSDEEGYDPHIWLSPKRVKTMIDEISKVLSKMDPENEETYKENAESYKSQLDKLDEEIRNIFSDATNKTFIINHPSLGYFADDYGLEMISLEEEGKEATARDLQEKINFAREHGIKTVFYQAEAGSKQARAFAENIGGEARMLEPLSPDYIDNLRRIAEAIVIPGGKTE